MKAIEGRSDQAFRRVRVAATEIALAAAPNIPGLLSETIEWLESIKRYDPLRFVPEKSRVLLDWWAYNGKEILSGNPAKAAWLPAEKSLTSNTFETWYSRSAEGTPPPPPLPPPESAHPKFARLLPIAETFEQWSARVNSQTLDLTWTAVDYEKGSSVALSEEMENTSVAKNFHDSKGLPLAASPIGARDESEHTLGAWLPVSAVGCVVLVLLFRKFYRRE